MSQQQPAPTEDAHVSSPHEVGQRTIKEIIADLSKPLPDRLLSKKNVGGTDIKYISWHTAVKILDYRAPGWTWAITNLTHLNGRVGMTGRLTIPASDGHPDSPTVVDYFRDASGTEEDDQDKYGDPVSNAESMCFRRAAAKFGLGLGLYGGQRQQPPPQQGTQRPTPPTRPAAAAVSRNAAASQGQQPQRAGSGSPPISEKQVSYAISLANEKGVNIDDIVAEIVGKNTLEDCTIAEGKLVIDHLLALPKF